MWVLVFVTGFAFGFGIIVLNETFPPVILGKKAKRLRKEKGNKDLMTIFEASEEGESLWHKIGKNLIRPTKLLTGNVIVFVFSLYMALTYGNSPSEIVDDNQDIFTYFLQHFLYFSEQSTTRISESLALTTLASASEPYLGSLPQ